MTTFQGLLPHATTPPGAPGTLAALYPAGTLSHEGRVVAGWLTFSKLSTGNGSHVTHYLLTLCRGRSAEVHEFDGIDLLHAVLSDVVAGRWIAPMPDDDDDPTKPVRWSLPPYRVYGVGVAGAAVDMASFLGLLGPESEAYVGAMSRVSGADPDVVRTHVGVVGEILSPSWPLSTRTASPICGATHPIAGDWVCLNSAPFVAPRLDLSSTSHPYGGRDALAHRPGPGRRRPA